MPPWDDWGRELDEWVDEDDTEFERECGAWIGRKSRGMDVGIMCMLTAVMLDDGGGDYEDNKSKRQWCYRQKKLDADQPGRTNENKGG